jgi:hypothetical protein
LPFKCNLQRYTEDAARQYGFTAFAITLNELAPEMLQNLPPTDSRLRPDMRALEEGNGEKASSAKLAVEDLTRKLAAIRKKNRETYSPVWFTKRSDVGAGGRYVNYCEHGVGLCKSNPVLPHSARKRLVSTLAPVN